VRAGWCGGLQQPGGRRGRAGDRVQRGSLQPTENVRGTCKSLVAPLPKLDRSAIRFAHLHTENLVEQKDHACEAPSEADSNSRKRTLSNRVYRRFYDDSVASRSREDIGATLP
jgi:hypothetical protein